MACFIALVTAITALTRLDGAIPASSPLALTVAEIRLHQVAVVAFFASRAAIFEIETLNPVATASHLAPVGAGIMSFCVAIITRLVVGIAIGSIQPKNSIPTLGPLAGVQASVCVIAVAIVTVFEAFLTFEQITPLNAVAAARQKALVGTSIVGHQVAIVTLFTSVEEGIPTNSVRVQDSRSDFAAKGDDCQNKEPSSHVLHRLRRGEQ